MIYAAIVAAWAAFLVPRWVRRNEEIEQAAETDAVRGVRVLQRRTPTIRAGHSRPEGTVLHGRADGLLVGGSSASEAGSVSLPQRGAEKSQDLDHPVAAVDAAFAAAARRRRRMLTYLVLSLVTSGIAAFLGYLPTTVPVVVVGLLVVFLLLARRAAVAQARRRRAAVRRAAVLAERSAAEVEAEVDDDDSDHVELTADGKRIAVYEPPEMPEVDPDAWEPVAVPRPIYLDKAVAPAPRARSIDLRSPGAWTSGRLDPAGSIELPPQRREPIAAPAPAESAESPEEREDYPDHRRAVGD